MTFEGTDFKYVNSISSSSPKIPKQDIFGPNFIFFPLTWEHGTIIQTGRTCKKISCYMCEPACR